MSLCFISMCVVKASSPLRESCLVQLIAACRSRSLSGLPCSRWTEPPCAPPQPGLSSRRLYSEVLAPSRKPVASPGPCLVIWTLRLRLCFMCLVLCSACACVRVHTCLCTSHSAGVQAFIKHFVQARRRLDQGGTLNGVEALLSVNR